MSRSDSSSQSDKDEQMIDDGSEDDDNSDNNDPDNENENIDKKQAKGKRKKLKRKKINRYFNDDSVKIDIKNDKMFKDIHKYKVSFNLGEKTFTRWISEKVMLEKAKDVLDLYNLRPKKIKKRKIKKSIRRQQKVMDEENFKNANNYDNEKIGDVQVLESNQIQKSSPLPVKPEKVSPKQVKEVQLEEGNNKDQILKTKTKRSIETVLGMKKRENANFPDFIVKFSDSSRYERISWKKMHELYKINLLFFYEQHISEKSLRQCSLPEGIQVEENLHFLTYANS